MALAAIYDWEIFQADFVTAFLNASLCELIYMKPPPGYKLKDGKPIVLKLLKSIYGLKQASYEWYKKLAGRLEQMGFKTTIVEKSVLVAQKGDMIILMIYLSLLRIGKEVYMS